MTLQKLDSDTRSVSTTLLQRARDYDDVSWRQLVDLFSPFVYRWFRRWGIAEHDAPDLVQTCFLRVAQNIGKFSRKKEGDSFRGWLWQIASNIRFDFLRGTKEYQVDTDLLEDKEDVDVEDAENEAAMLLHRVLEMIRGDFQESTFQVFERCELQGHDTRQVAKELNMSSSAVREAKRRVKNRLRDECLSLLGTGFWPFDFEKSIAPLTVRKH